MNNLSTFLPCGKAGYFPTPATYEWSVSSVRGETAKRTEINTGGKTLMGHFNPLTGNNKQARCEDLWTGPPNLPASNFHIAAVNSECLQHLLNGTPFCAATAAAAAVVVVSAQAH